MISGTCFCARATPRRHDPGDARVHRIARDDLGGKSLDVMVMVRPVPELRFANHQCAARDLHRVIALHRELRSHGHILVGHEDLALPVIVIRLLDVSEQVRADEVIGAFACVTFGLFGGPNNGAAQMSLTFRDFHDDALRWVDPVSENAVLPRMSRNACGGQQG